MRYVLHHRALIVDTRCDIHLWIFIIPSLMVLAIAVLTTFFFNVKAARTNPADLLRYE